MVIEKKGEVDFGYKNVPVKEKEPLVKNIFNSVAPKYDLMNDLMSFGMHRLWKKRFISKVSAAENSTILDLAAGTGDISFLIYERYKSKGIKNFNIVLSDINEEMLSVAKNKVVNKNCSKNINCEVINSEKIPYNDNHFNYCTIAFGIRNVTNRDKALKEIYRVLKPGGKFLCLEFSPVKEGLYKKLYDFYSFSMIPKIGRTVAKDEESYQYLVESIRKFPDTENFKKMIDNSGFVKTSYEKLSGGSVAIHTGYKS